MCNLYRMTRTVDEVAQMFGAVNHAAGSNLGAEVYPGYPGLVVERGHLRQMTWGFPLQMKGAKGQLLKPKPVNNARTDKLASFFWKSSFDARRCLIPLSAWAEAQGPKGAMTRTWLALPGTNLFAAAGIWRSSAEWGDVYSMVMTDSAGPAAEVHRRMPVVLHPDHYPLWLAGEPDVALDLCRSWDGPVSIERTGESWSGGAGPRLV
ncbi:SOS response-associated peptidase [Allopontixanthobacter sp.]|uniref:SOS response-associated peptidase n=1 Tax=Allopontixanthobacter sp. TaxID=2906452 RepID=UPI002ABC474C|nr:SOS response-associated peptidase family protein [Allopontixanthobacter sp.]MDZ4306591.1 SOS response-associated peptidase family protein [Allopontixanthobacter sp.]